MYDTCCCVGLKGHEGECCDTCVANRPKVRIKGPDPSPRNFGPFRIGPFAISGKAWPANQISWYRKYELRLTLFFRRRAFAIDYTAGRVG